MPNVAIIYGGNSHQSRLKGLYQKTESYFKKEGFSTEAIFVHELPAEDLLSANYASEAIAQANAKVANASVVVVLTPVYKAAYSGILKSYLDLLPQKGLEGKAVLPLVLGGSFGHLLAIDYALKPVLSSLGATTILSGAYVLDTHIEKLGNEQFFITAEIDERVDRVLKLAKEESTRALRAY
ncbi:NADPH-dependent FMN reductase [Shouchella clausii]|uniref:NADPH-dependent FMN reductase n=1 Tax=Shouchella clausii TaxID=79880 RepID=UPI000B969CCD|nr:NADPH-dependent FMN reductase [Shouchella clausii]AST96113.1 FMN reductase (NADPH) [Shouchella clausii]MCR1289487.1 NADPH-dependent FMN reductase [Shouchella clausii]MEB5473698.1 NADPH-dependent FMN reductase [Shouchella clausii]MEB5479264.1 NADPH-dependent FMN reductase [Shouchella clausii]PAD14711.1 FMN reductase (NADPH) [Shouchella clausii]